MRIDDLFEGDGKMYSGIHFKDGTHMTWKFGRPLVYPDGVSPGDKATVKVVGKYSDADVACHVVEWEGHKTQPSKDTVLHITTRVENGIKPVESGLRATKKGFKKVDTFVLEGVWK